ncbi:MAG: endonuclease [Prevotellaceae bacterium]|jgi:predicted extracellular nuclease|nr:endonuclease [Prevotellaceae bacterium]
MKRITTSIVFFILLFVHALPAQNRALAEGDVRIMFYNTENYFWPLVDSLDPLPPKDYSTSGSHHWTWNRFEKKTGDLYKVIASVGELTPPALIGLCEVENRWVLNRLIYETPLAKYPYGIVHQDSPDGRGIDVALLYQKSTFNLLGRKFFPVTLSNGRKTRDILYAKGVVNELDTLHVLVCHMPSKYGGAVFSETSRMEAAKTLRKITDSLLHSSTRANIVVMGDFNDTPDSKSVAEALCASNNLDGNSPDSLYNLAIAAHKSGVGSIKFQGKWELIDLIFVSGNLLNVNEPIYCISNAYRIFFAPYLLENDNAYTGQKPYRTYNGFKYNGGISDHLPAVLDLRKGY